MHFHGTSVRQQALTLLRDGARNVDVARRDSVALMDRHIGPKH
ncbi:hypothetical protein [Streptomyces sp. NPDC023838]